MRMKKIFTLIGVALMVISTNAQSWNFSTWEAKTFAKGSTETIDGLTVNPSEKDIVIDGNNKTVDGVKYTQRLKFGGSGSPTTQNISFDVSGAGTLKVIVTSSSGSEDRKFGVALEGTEIAEKDAKGGAVEAVTVNITGAGKVAIYGKGGVNLYLVEFTAGGGSGGGGSEGGKFTYTLATVDGAVADFSNPTDSKGRLFAKVNKDPIVIKAVAGKLPANADGGAQQMTPDKTKPIEGRENTYAVKSVEAWSDASFNTNNKFTDWNSIDPKYNMYYLSGTGNPYTMLYAQEIMKTEGEEKVPTDTYKADYDYYTPDGGKLPATGMYFKLTPKANGTLKLGIFANKGDRKTFLVEESSKATVAYTAEGYVANRKYPDGHEKAGKMMYLTNEEIQAIATEDGSSEYVIGSKNAHFYGFITATVEKGKSYYLFLHNGQMGLSSVEFNYDEASLDKAIDETDEIANTPDPTDPSYYTGITSIKNDAINSNAQMYNLSGQKVDKSYKGIVIQNGRKFVNK